MNPPRRVLRFALGALLALAACDDPDRPEPVAAVEVTAPSAFVDVGQTLQLTVALKGTSGQALTDREIEWTSSSEAVATVQGGVVTGKSAGKATITASAGGQRATFDVTVEPAVGSVEVSPSALTLAVGTSARISQRVVVSVVDPAGGSLSGKHSVQFSSSAPGVAEVSDSGVVRAIAPGTAALTVRAGSRSERITVTVERPYTLTFLGTLPGKAESRATAINELGQVTGVSGSQAFVWQNGQMAALAFPDSLGAPYVPFANAINESGQVAGTLLNTSTGATYVFLWQNGRTTATFFEGPGIERRVPTVRDLNDRGEIALTWRSSSCTRSCRLGGYVVRDGQLVALSDQGALGVEANAINNSGRIAGTLNTTSTRGGDTRALFLESATAQPVLLPTGAPVSEGLGINDQGVVVGQGWLSGTGPRESLRQGSQAFLWTPGSTPTLLAPYWTSSTATRINNRGVAIGSMSAPCGQASLCTYAVIFRNGEAVRIGDLFAQGDWSFDEATGINDRGQVVGYGKNRTTGATGALLLTPAQ